MVSWLMNGTGKAEKMKYYIASGFGNKEKVRSVSERLKNMGYLHTYDWTKNERASSIVELKVIGQIEKDAINEADFIVVLLPAGKGSHIEFGIALGQGKKIFLYSPNEEVFNLQTTSTFYHLPEVEIVTGNIDVLVEKIKSAVKF